MNGWVDGWVANGWWMDGQTEGGWVGGQMGRWFSGLGEPVERSICSCV